MRLADAVEHMTWTFDGSAHGTFVHVREGPACARAEA